MSGLTVYKTAPAPIMAQWLSGILDQVIALYGDLSDRVASIIAGMGPAHEIYSIDESFVDLAGVPGDLTDRARRVRERILQWVGIPCGVGIGAPRRLQNLATLLPKQQSVSLEVILPS